jgi:lysophospholipase L1-like esterase
MFEQEHIDRIRAFFATYPRYAEVVSYRELQPWVGQVTNLFYGDSITAAWPLHEFFPSHSLLNRGIGGDSVYGLYDRMAEDVFPYQPKRVFLFVGINGIQEPAERILAHIQALAERLVESGTTVAVSSILPLREPDNWDRFQYQEKIVAINGELAAYAAAQGHPFLDYHGAVRDDTGQLAAENARPDGTHVTLAAYRCMADVVRPHLL